MAQSGYTPILIYSSSTGGNAPAAGNLTNSALGSELAINITDGKLFYKDNANDVQVIAWKITPTTAGGTGLSSYTAGDMLYYAAGSALTKLTIGASTTIMTSSGSAPQWSTASSITVGKATNLDGGAAGSVPYQTGAGATTFLGIGASGRYLSSTGSVPQWSAPAALTKTDDTNVTLTLGGNASTALLNAASLTLGWTGTLATSRGGTGLSSFTANGVVYASSTSALATSSNLTYSTDFTVTGGNLRSVKTSGAPAAFVHSNQAGGAGTTPTVQFYRTGASATATPNNNNVGAIRFDGLDANNSFANFGLINVEIFTNAAGGAPADMTFHTSASGASAVERMRIFSDGGVSIGNTTSAGTGNLRLATSKFIRLPSASTNFDLKGNAGGNDYLSIDANGTQRHQFNDAGAAYNTTGTWGTISDARLKENINDATAKLDDVLKLRVVNYNLKTDPEIKQIGFVAQEIEQVFPGLVQQGEPTEDGDFYKSVKTSVLIPILVKAMQEQQTQIDELKNQLSQLKGN